MNLGSYREPTPVEYQHFATELCAWSGATLVDKSALEMDIVSVFLDIAGIADREDFLQHTATTFGTVIYMPYEDIDVLVHENVHVGQYAPRPDVNYGKVLDAIQRQALETASNLSPFVKDILARLRIDESRIRVHGLGFAWLYLVHPEERARFEAYGYAGQMEFIKMRTGRLVPLEDMVSRLQYGYALDADAVALAKAILTVRRTEVAAGVYRSAVALKAREILYGISPELVVEAP